MISPMGSLVHSWQQSQDLFPEILCPMLLHFPTGQGLYLTYQEPQIKHGFLIPCCILGLNPSPAVLWATTCNSRFSRFSRSLWCYGDWMTKSTRNPMKIMKQIERVWEPAETEDCQEFEANLGYIVKSRSAWATIQKSMLCMTSKFFPR